MTLHGVWGAWEQPCLTVGLELQFVSFGTDLALVAGPSLSSFLPLVVVVFAFCHLFIRCCCVVHSLCCVAGMPTYLVLFVHRHYDFLLPELQSVCSLFGVPFTPLDVEHFDPVV
jgi:hypothetical protein